MTEEHSKSLVKRYVSPESYRTRHMLLGLLILLLCAGIFAVLAVNISTIDPLVGFDTVVVDAIHANTSPQLIPIMLLISNVGYEVPLALTIILIVYFVWKHRWTNLALFTLAVLGEQILEEITKLLFHRNRPAFSNPILLISDYSFPSGHVMLTTVFYGLLAYLLIRREKGWLGRVLIAGSFALIVTLVGFSRVYLGAHYPSDVIGGFIVGLAWLAVATSLVDISRKRNLEQQSLNQPSS